MDRKYWVFMWLNSYCEDLNNGISLSQNKQHETTEIFLQAKTCYIVKHTVNR